MKKTRWGWAVMHLNEKSPYRNTITGSKKDTLCDFLSKTNESWKYCYRHGYRIRRITISWEE